MTDSVALDTYKALVSTFSQLLTVATHTILYERGLYPVGSFISARKFNSAVRQSRHPGVCTWVNDAVTAVEDELLKGNVSKVAFVIFSSKLIPLERFIFDVSRFPVVPPNEIYTPFDPSSATVLHRQIDLEEQLRAVMRSLTNCGSSLGKLPEGCTFTLSMELKDEAEAPLDHPQAWIPSQPSQQPASIRALRVKGADIGGVRTVPVRAVEAGEFVLEVWAEESAGKLQLDESITYSLHG